MDIADVDSVKRIPAQSHFTSCYEVWFSQKLDHTDPESVRFRQKVVLGHVGFNEPVVVEIQGYGIRRTSSYELALRFQCNQLQIEHRYFERSRPKELVWPLLTTWQAATDQHEIILRIREALYPESPFVTTGISKGGQCTLLHSALYPTDAVASVPYVAPLNFAREDERIYTFLETVGTKKQRKAITAFQKLCFAKRNELVPLLDAMAEEKNWHWNMSTDSAFTYYVLEYSFALWQWGGVNFDSIPTKKSSDAAILNHVLEVSGISFFEESGVEALRPFFWAAHTEIGMYGYQTKSFKKYLNTTEPYLFAFTLPEGDHPVYDPTAVNGVQEYLDTEAENIICIYGGMDTWGATRVNLNETAASRNCQVYVLETGHHQTRIAHFPESTRQEILQKLEPLIGKKALAY